LAKAFKRYKQKCGQTPLVWITQYICAAAALSNVTAKNVALSSLAEIHPEVLLRVTTSFNGF